MPQSSAICGATAAALNHGVSASTTQAARKPSTAHRPGGSSNGGDHRVDQALATQHLGAVVAAGDAAQSGDRLVGARLEHLGLRRHGVADVDRCGVVPLLVEEDAARTGQPLGDERIEQPGGEPALHHQAPDASARGELPVEVERVAIPAEPRKGLHVVRREGARPGRAGSDVRRLPAHESSPAHAGVPKAS